MKYVKALFATHCIIATLILFGCASVEETSEKPKQETPPPVVQKEPEQTPTPAAETVTPPPEQQKSAQKDTAIIQPHKEFQMAESQQTPSGNFSVQAGAFADAAKAEKASALAKERFGNNVYRYYIKEAGLFKVYIGDFMTKEDARKFRDKIVQQFPDDYKDAWVAPIPYEKK